MESSSVFWGAGLWELKRRAVRVGLTVEKPRRQHREPGDRAIARPPGQCTWWPGASLSLPVRWARACSPAPAPQRMEQLNQRAWQTRKCLRAEAGRGGAGGGARPAAPPSRESQWPRRPGRQYRWRHGGDSKCGPALGRGPGRRPALQAPSRSPGSRFRRLPATALLPGLHRSLRTPASSRCDPLHSVPPPPLCSFLSPLASSFPSL